MASLREDAATIRKAMVQVEVLSKSLTAQNLNQATRWITTCGHLTFSKGPLPQERVALR